jgi:hypothetical protein
MTNPLLPLVPLTSSQGASENYALAPPERAKPDEDKSIGDGEDAAQHTRDRPLSFTTCENHGLA